jgi:hypothetical protein
MGNEVTADLTPEALDRLEAAAKAATPGPWHPRETSLLKAKVFVFVKDSGRGDIASIADRIEGPRAVWNATHIAAFDPETVLALLSMARRTVEAEADRDSLYLVNEHHHDRIEALEAEAETAQFALKSGASHQKVLEAEVERPGAGHSP